jgi:hypothetical protein
MIQDFVNSTQIGMSDGDFQLESFSVFRLIQGNPAPRFCRCASVSEEVWVSIDIYLQVGF